MLVCQITEPIANFYLDDANDELDVAIRLYFENPLKYSRPDGEGRPFHTDNMQAMRLLNMQEGCEGPEEGETKITSESPPKLVFPPPSYRSNTYATSGAHNRLEDLGFSSESLQLYDTTFDFHDNAFELHDDKTFEMRDILNRMREEYDELQARFESISIQLCDTHEVVAVNCATIDELSLQLCETRAKNKTLEAECQKLHRFRRHALLEQENINEFLEKEPSHTQSRFRRHTLLKTLENFVYEGADAEEESVVLIGAIASNPLSTPTTPTTPTTSTPTITPPTSSPSTTPPTTPSNVSGDEESEWYMLSELGVSSTPLKW